MKWEAAIDEVLAEMGLAATVRDGDGAFSLLFDNEHEVSFEPDADDGSVLFHAEVGDTASLDAAGLRSLLEASLLGANTAGAAFSIDSRFGKVVLWKRCPEFPNAAALRRELEYFLGQVIHWKARIASGLADATETASSIGFNGSFLQV